MTTSTNRAKNRAERRALAAHGVAVLHRVSLESGAIAKAVENGASALDLVAFQVAGALENLAEQGADIIGGRTVVTIGTHPDYPDALTIEAKASKRLE